MDLSVSLVSAYKKCRRFYELRYKENVYPKVTAQALQDGTSYHDGIERYYKEGVFQYDENNPKVSAMIQAYIKYIAPHFNVKVAEEWFTYKLTPKHNIVGRFDAITEDGFGVEHKTTSRDIDDEYIYDLYFDEQIPTYMLANGCNKMFYTVCKKPTIRQKQHETAEEFYNRCLEWYAEDTDKKIRVLQVTRTEEEIKEHRHNLVKIAQEIDKCKFFYRCPTSCTSYGRKCEYSSICLNYDPNIEYVEFEKRKSRHYEEVKNNGLF